MNVRESDWWQMGLLYTPLEQFGTIDTHKYSWVKYPVLCDWEYKTEMFLWIHLCILLELLFPCPSPHKMLIEILHSHLFPYGINWHLGVRACLSFGNWELGPYSPTTLLCFYFLLTNIKPKPKTIFEKSHLESKHFLRNVGKCWLFYWKMKTTHPTTLSGWVKLNSFICALRLIGRELSTF